MPQWFEVTWPPKDQHPSLPKAIDIVQHYLMRSRGDVARLDVALATEVILGVYRLGERRHLMLADKAIVALETRRAVKPTNASEAVTVMC
jgi:hypothetical protein